MEVSDNTVELIPPTASCYCRQCLCWPSPESETSVIAPFTRSFATFTLCCCAWTCTVIYYIESLRTTLQSLHTRHIDFPPPSPFAPRCSYWQQPPVGYATILTLGLSCLPLSHTRFLSFPHWYQAGWPPFGPLTRLVLLYSACFVLLRLVINEPPLAAFNNARLSINLAGACSDSVLAWRIHVPFLFNCWPLLASPPALDRQFRKRFIHSVNSR